MTDTSTYTVVIHLRSGGTIRGTEGAIDAADLDSYTSDFEEALSDNEGRFVIATPEGRTVIPQRSVDYLTIEDTRAGVHALYQALGDDDPEETR